MSTEVYEEEFEFESNTNSKNQIQINEINGDQLTFEIKQRQKDLQTTNIEISNNPNNNSDTTYLNSIIGFILFLLSPSTIHEYLELLLIGILKLFGITLLLSFQYGIDFIQFSWNGVKTLTKFILFF